MCGIFGFDKLTPQTRAMAPFLAWAMEDRGSHSWGATNGSECIRFTGPITDTFELPEHWDQIIVHTRHATTGAHTVENAHPFQFEHIIGIHNGIIWNHDELNRTLNRNFSVDSMHIFANIFENKPLDILGGTAALAWYDNCELNLCRINSTNLIVCQLESGEIIFCSTRSAIEKAARFVRAKIKEFFFIKEGYVYKFGVVNDEYSLIETDIQHKFRVNTVVTSSNYNTSTYNYNYGNNNHNNLIPIDKCAMCKTVPVKKKELLCESCFSGYSMYIDEFTALDINNNINDSTSKEATNSFLRRFINA